MTGEKQVFISHSSKDFEFAINLCQTFEEAGIGCWIAPRDIPYGNVWAAEITQGIEKARLMLFILSEHSAGSNQVVREISLALQQGLLVIPVRMDGSKLSGALAYYLSNVQAIQLDPDSPEQLGSLLEHVRACLEGKRTEHRQISAPAQSPEENEEFRLDTDVNFDEELDAKFDQLFGPEAQKREEVSPFRQKLLKRIGNRVLDTMALGGRTGEKKPERMEESPKKETWGRRFSIIDRDSVTQIFLIQRTYCLPDYHVVWTMEPMKFATEYLEDGALKRTYFVENPNVEGNQLFLVTALPKQAMVVLNMGWLDTASKTVKISDQPLPMSALQGEKGQIMKWPANEGGRTVLVDPETGMIVPRKRYYDREKRIWVTYIELMSGKTYVASAIRDPLEDTEDLRQKNFRIALGFYRGCYGLPQNMLKAAEFFELSGTPEAHYYLGRIFLEDPLLGDPEDARYYLTLALEGGEERARALL